MTDAGLELPELGPSIGRLVAPPPPPPGAPGPWIALDDLRLALVSRLFEVAGEARRRARAGDRDRALATLDGAAWAITWQQAVDAVAARAAETIASRLLAAAAEARLSRRKTARLPLDQDEVRALAGRLAHAGGDFHHALAALDAAAEDLRTQGASQATILRWQEAQCAAARRLEAAWLSLEGALAQEGRTWEREVEEIRAWRAPRWPLLAVSVGLFVLALGAGLVLGGYLPVPEPLRPAVEAVWARWN